MLESTLIPNQSTYGFQSQLNTSYGIVFGKLAGFKRYEQRFVVMWNMNHRRWIICSNLFLSLSLFYKYISCPRCLSLSLSLMHVFIYLYIFVNATSCATFFFVFFLCSSYFLCIVIFVFFLFTFSFLFVFYFLLTFLLSFSFSSLSLVVQIFGRWVGEISVHLRELVSLMQPLLRLTQNNSGWLFLDE